MLLLLLLLLLFCRCRLCCAVLCAPDRHQKQVKWLSVTAAEPPKSQSHSSSSSIAQTRPLAPFGVPLPQGWLVAKGRGRCSAVVSSSTSSRVPTQ
jgi:hypothetical protein